MQLHIYKIHDKFLYEWVSNSRIHVIHIKAALLKKLNASWQGVQFNYRVT